MRRPFLSMVMMLAAMIPVSSDTVNDNRTKDGKPAKDPDGGPLKRTFSAQDRADLQRIAWEGLKEFRQIAGGQ